MNKPNKKTATEENMKMLKVTSMTSDWLVFIFLVAITSVSKNSHPTNINKMPKGSILDRLYLNFGLRYKSFCHF
ncbi:MAG: hypothetical protein RJQ05_11540 [Cytophagales bacterium]